MDTDDALPSSGPDLRPHFVDNREGNTLDVALRAYLRTLREGQQQFVFADVATAYFNLPGFDLLADEFGKVAQLRLLLGAEPRPEPQWPEPQPGEARDEAFAETTRKMVREHDLFLQGLHAGKVVRKELMQELSPPRTITSCLRNCSNPARQSI